MAYLPPHKRHPSSTASAPTSNPPPPSLSSSLRSLSLSSPRGRGRGRGGCHPHPSNKIIHAPGCIFRWYPLPPFSLGSEDGDGDGDGEEPILRLEPFPCDPIELKNGAKPLTLVTSSPRQDSSGSTATAVTAITERLLPDLLTAAERAKASYAPKEEELVKLSLVAKVGKVLFQTQPGRSPVSLETLRQAAKAGEDGSNSQLHKLFYTSVPSECLDDMEQSMVKRMALEYDSSKEHYQVKVFDKHSDSTITCKCTVEEDGSLAIRKVQWNQVRHLVEDISCLFKGFDLRLMLCTKSIMKTLDPEVENALMSLVSSAVIDPNVKGGLRWPLGKESIGERFSIVGVWHSNYKAFRNESLRLKLRHADRFDHQSSTGEVSDEVTFKLIGMSRRLEEADPEETSLKEMLESAVQMVWDNALNNKIAP